MTALAPVTLLLGIDPGVATGVAFYREGTLTALQTIAPEDFAALLQRERPQQVVLEDSRLQSAVFVKPGLSRQAMLKVARNVGMIDGMCRDFTIACELADIPCTGISPRQKGGKLKAPYFAQITGYSKRCNQHERDAAMVARPFRHGRQGRQRSSLGGG
ncbi:MAG: hypothetical protein JKX92_05960 [Porticoccaceae bacterium]|nr:hypothetical protein [Porticoccaceae bacterium]